MSRVKDKVALITGAAKGIGLAAAKMLKSEGAVVIMTDIDEKEGTAQALSIGAVFYPLDVSNQVAWEALEKIVKKEYGKLDIIINNAGVTGVGIGLQDPENIRLEDWRYVHQVNLDSVMLGCQFAIRLMKDHGGSIVNMSSMSGINGVPTACAYASSKAAIRNHTKSVALYCAQMKYGIRCNSIHPGAIKTPMWDPMLSDEETRQEIVDSIESKIPLGVMGEAEDVANTILFLASEESRYLTGIELIVDGGQSAG